MRRGIILRDSLKEVRLALPGARAEVERVELRRFDHRHPARGVGGEDVAARDDKAVERQARVETEERGVGGGLRRLEIGQRRRREVRRAVVRRGAAAHHDAAHCGQLLPPRKFEPVAETFVDPVGRETTDGFERHDSRHRAIIGKAHGLQPMVEGADAEVAAQPFGDARPERGGIAVHRSVSCVMPMPIAALCHAVPPPQVPFAPEVRAAGHMPIRRLRRAQVLIRARSPKGCESCRCDGRQRKPATHLSSQGAASRSRARHVKILK